jgi:hypothetical protein
MEFVYFIGIVVFLVCNFIVAGEFASIADKKGYDGTKYGVYTFFFGIAGMLIAVPLFSAGYRLMKEDVVKRNWKPKDAVITEDVNSEGIVETREQEEEISTDENGDH